MDIMLKSMYISNKELVFGMEKIYDPEIKMLLCNYMESINEWNHKNVSSSCWYFYWNNSPGAFIKHNGTEYKLEPDKFFLIAPETEFSTGLKSPFNHFYIHFIAGSPFDQIKNRIFLFHTDEIVLKQIETVCSIDPDRNLSAAHRILLGHSIICCMLMKIKATEFTTLKRYDPRIEAAISILNKNTSTILSNENVAELVGMSVNGFIRLFLKEFGITPQKYSRIKRIEKASILLHFTDKTIDQIAKETGFLDRFHFSRVFKETTKHTPVEFRKRKISF